MFNPTYFLVFFTFLLLIVFAIAHLALKKTLPLRKAWVIYSLMYGLYVVMFLGTQMSLPFTYPVYRSRVDDVNSIQKIEDFKNELSEQRRDLERLQNDVDQMNRSMNNLLQLLAMLGPLIFYNIFKYNLRIEGLTGKRMGSFD